MRDFVCRIASRIARPAGRRLISPTAIALFLAALTGLGPIAAPASAASPEAPQIRVRAADLDLAKPADLAKLNRRIARSLEAVCGSYAQAGIEEAQEIAQCRTAAATRSSAAIARLARDRAAQLAAR